MATIATAAFALLTVAHPPAARAEVEPIACLGSLLPNTSTNGKDDRDDQISARMTIWADSSGTRNFIGYEYETYGRQEFVQFPTLFPSTLFPLHGSVYAALKNALTTTKTPRDALPPAFRQLAPGTPIERGTCN